MDQKWRSEERKLWDAMHAWPCITSGSRKGRRMTERAKRAGHKLPKLPTDEEAAAKSWAVYRAWIAH